MRMQKMLMSAVLIGLGGCASQQDYHADSGSPYPTWCAEVERQMRDTQPPASRENRRSSLPPECREQAEGIRIWSSTKPARSD